jgi:hypothetical protein
MTQAEFKRKTSFTHCTKEALSKRADKTNSTILKSYQAVSVMLQIAAHSGVGNTSLLVSNKIKDNILELSKAAGLRVSELPRKDYRVPKTATLLEFDWF